MPTLPRYRRPRMDTGGTPSTLPPLGGGSVATAGGPPPNPLGSFGSTLQSLMGQTTGTQGGSTTSGSSTGASEQTGTGTSANQLVRENSQALGQMLGQVGGDPAQLEGAGFSLENQAADPTTAARVLDLSNPYAFSQIQSTFAAETPQFNRDASQLAGNFASNPYSDAGPVAEAVLRGQQEMTMASQATGIEAGAYQNALAAVQADEARKAQLGMSQVGQGAQYAGLVPGAVMAGNVDTTGQTSQQQQAQTEQQFQQATNFWQQQQKNDSLLGNLGGIASDVGLMFAKHGGAIRPRFAPGGPVTPYYVPGMAWPTSSASPAPWTAPQPHTDPISTSNDPMGTNMQPSWSTPAAPALPTRATAAAPNTSFAPYQPPATPTAAPTPTTTTPPTTPAPATPTTSAPPAATPATAPTTVLPPPQMPPATPNTILPPAPKAPTAPSFAPINQPAPATASNPPPAPAATTSGTGAATWAQAQGPITSGTASAGAPRPIPSFGTAAPQNPLTAPAFSASITPYTNKSATPSGAVANMPFTGYGTPQPAAHGGVIEDHHRFADKVAHAFHAFHAMRKHAQDPGLDGRQHLEVGGVGDGGWGAATTTSIDPTSADPSGDAVVNKALASDPRLNASSQQPSFMQRLAKAAGSLAHSGSGSSDKGGGSSGLSGQMPNIPIAQTASAQFSPMNLNPIMPRVADGGAIPRYSSGGEARPHYEDGGVGGFLSGLFGIGNNTNTASPPPSDTPPLRPGDPASAGGTDVLNRYGIPQPSQAQLIFQGLGDEQSERGTWRPGIGRAFAADREARIKAADLIQRYETQQGHDISAAREPTLDARRVAIEAQKLPYQIQEMQARNVPGQIYTSVVPKLYETYNTRVAGLASQEAQESILPAQYRRGPEYYAQMRARLWEELQKSLDQAQRTYAHPTAQGVPAAQGEATGRRNITDVPGYTPSTPGTSGAGAP